MLPSWAAGRRHRRTHASSAKKRPVPPSPCSRWARPSASAGRARQEHRGSGAPQPGPAALRRARTRVPTTVNRPGAVKSGQRRARPGTYLLPDGYAVRRRGRNARGRHVQQRRRHGRPLDRRLSAAGRQGAHRRSCPELDELLDEADRLLGVTTHAFDGAPFSDLVRGRLAAAADEGRDPAYRVQPMPLAVHRREDGGLVWSGSDVVMGDVTRENPHFDLFDESLVTRVLVEDGRAAGVEVQDRRTGESHQVARPLRGGGRGCPAHAAAAVGLRHPSRRPGPVPQRPGADGVRGAGSATVSAEHAPAAADGATQRVKRRDLGALHGRHALPRPGHAAGCVPCPAGRGRPHRPGIDRRAGPVLRQGPPAGRTGWSSTTAAATRTGCPP